MVYCVVQLQLFVFPCWTQDAELKKMKFRGKFLVFLARSDCRIITPAFKAVPLTYI